MASCKNPSLLCKAPAALITRKGFNKFSEGMDTGYVKPQERQLKKKLKNKKIFLINTLNIKSVTECLRNSIKI